MTDTERIIEAVVVEVDRIVTSDAVVDYHTPEQVPLTAALVELYKAMLPIDRSGLCNTLSCTCCSLWKVCSAESAVTAILREQGVRHD